MCPLLGFKYREEKQDSNIKYGFPVTEERVYGPDRVFRYLSRHVGARKPIPEWYDEKETREYNEDGTYAFIKKYYLHA